MNNPQQAIIVFVSRDCRHCPELIQKIQQKPQMQQLVRVIEVEQIPEQQLPPNLTSVPAIMFEGKLLMGRDALSFVDSFGEMEALPIPAKGSLGSNYSDFGSDTGSLQNTIISPMGSTGSFSYLGEQDGTAGLDPNITVDHTQNEKNSLKSLNLEALNKQRQQEFQR